MEAKSSSNSSIYSYNVFAATPCCWSSTITKLSDLVSPESAEPIPAIEAIAVAIQEWQGHTSHADTEARVLREWLAAERKRVDRVLFPGEAA